MDNGKSPYLGWQKGLTQRIRDAVTVRLARLRLGNFGDCKKVEGDKGLYELRIHMSPGIRIYFGKRGKKVVILLCGGRNEVDTPCMKINFYHRSQSGVHKRRRSIDGKNKKI